MAFKVCSHCQQENGVRAHRCKHCQNPFPVRVVQELLPVAKIVPIGKRVRRYSKVEWTELRAGDRIKVAARSGPYYEDTEGNKRYLTGGGVFRVLSLDKRGINVRGEGKKSCGFQFIYMGKTRQSPLAKSLVRQKHKIRLIRT